MNSCLIHALLESGTVITRSNLSWCYIQHCNDSSRTYIRFWTHKRHPIPRPHGRDMGCPLRGFGRKLIALYRHPTVSRSAMIGFGWLITRNFRTDVTIHPCGSSNSGLADSMLHFDNGWVIIYHSFTLMLLSLYTAGDKAYLVRLICYWDFFRWIFLIYFCHTDNLYHGEIQIFMTWIFIIQCHDGNFKFHPKWPLFFFDSYTHKFNAGIENAVAMWQRLWFFEFSNAWEAIFSCSF